MFNLCCPGWTLESWKKEEISGIGSELKVPVETAIEILKVICPRGKWAPIFRSNRDKRMFMLASNLIVKGGVWIFKNRKNSNYIVWNIVLLGVFGVNKALGEITYFIFSEINVLAVSI